LLETPRKYTLVAAAAEGPTRLNAFDNALLGAGIGNVNLLRVSSILPPGAQKAEELQIPPGSLVPTAYGAIESEITGEMIAAAIGVGIGEDGEYGVIMEFSGRCTKEDAEAEIRRMVEAAFEHRGRALREVHVKAVDHRVERMGCAFAAAALWY
jgi:arginine decarboxylase